MTHPFTKMLERALKKSTVMDNQVLEEAEKLREKGYPSEEIAGVLRAMHRGRIDDAESEIIAEALSEFEDYLEG